MNPFKLLARLVSSKNDHDLFNSFEENEDDEYVEQFDDFDENDFNNIMR